MKLITVLFFGIIALSSYGQKVKFKKELMPLITAETYTIESKDIALRYHRQNLNKNGYISDKAILMAYDYVYKTREYLGICYLYIGGTNYDLVALDSSIYYFELAQGMEGITDCSVWIESVKKRKKTVQYQIKKKKGDEEKRIADEKKKREQEEHDKLYAEKTATVTYVGGEFVGYCYVIFKDNNGDEVYFNNPKLGKFGNKDAMICGIKDMYANETFNITYKLGKVKVYSEAIQQAQNIDADVIVSIELADKQRAEVLNKEAVASCKSELDKKMVELQIYQKYDKFGIKKLVEQSKQATTPEGCEYMLKSVDDLLNKLRKQKNRFEIVEKEQKSKGECSSCVISVAKKFLNACIDVSGPQIKANLCKCGFDYKDPSCSNLDRHRPFNYSKYMEKPNVSGSKWYLERADDFVVYFNSDRIATIIKRPNKMTNRAKAIFMVKENGKWKVIGFDEEYNSDIILYSVGH